MEIFDLFLQYRNEKRNAKKRIITEMFEIGSEIANDYYQLLKECEIKTRDNAVKPDDIIREIEFRREKLHVRRQEARAMLQITYWEKNKAYKQLIYGISMILCGDNAALYMSIADHHYGRCGHTLLDIIDRYEWTKRYFNNNNVLIMEEMRRIIKCQYEAVDKGVKEMTEGYYKLVQIYK